MKPLPPPKTCTEAAQRLGERADDASTTYADRTRLKDFALIIGAFGDIPVPAPILERWDWSLIGHPAPEITIGERYSAWDNTEGRTVIITARAVRGRIVEGEDAMGQEYNCPMIALTPAD